MFPANFGYVAASSVEEALQLMAQHGENGKLLAGGHSLIPAMKLRLQSPQTLIDIATVPETGCTTPSQPPAIRKKTASAARNAASRRFVPTSCWSCSRPATTAALSRPK